MEKNKAYSRLEEVQKEVTALRHELNALNTEKEAAFSSRKSFGNKIKETINKIKSSKELRNSLSTSIKELKASRDAANGSLKGKLVELKKLKDERAKAAKHLDVKDNPARIKKEIEILEHRIEIEGMLFSKEQEVMKQIKVLKKKYDDNSVLNEYNLKIRAIMKDLDEARRTGNENHKKVQELAQQGQDAHETMITLSKEADALSTQEHEAYQKFNALKLKFNEMNELLKQKLDEMQRLQHTISGVREEKRQKKVQDDNQILKSKEELVAEKIRTGQKLTTEDLQVLQSLDSEDF